MTRHQPDTNRTSVHLALAAARRQLESRIPYIEAQIKSGLFMAASRELVLLEPPLRVLNSLVPRYGDGFGIVVHALRNAVLQHPGKA